MKQYLMFIISIGTGIFFWIVASKLTGEQEAFDSLYYFIIGLPVLMLINLIFGIISPKNSWVLGALSTISQFIPMILMGKSSPYWPVGLLTFAFLSIPSILAAILGSLLSKRVFSYRQNDHH